ncbi:hypothetical protein Tco_1457479 [Tanacetum coccineum]
MNTIFLEALNKGHVRPRIMNKGVIQILMSNQLQKSITPPVKKMGGLSIGSPSVSNLTMLSKSWWRLRTEPNPLRIKDPWKSIKSILQAVICPKLAFILIRKLGNNSINLWKDVWVKDGTWTKEFPRLFMLETGPDCCTMVTKTVSSMINMTLTKHYQLLNLHQFDFSNGNGSYP